MRGSPGVVHGGKLGTDMSLHVTDLNPPTQTSFLDGLNPQQREAVVHEGRRC